MKFETIISREETEAMLETIVRHRRELHRLAESGLDLPLTVGYVKITLESFGLSYISGGGGLWVDIGDEISSPLVAIRADMDALAMHEETGTVYASQNPQTMHACGHDAHTACLLACAELFSKNPPRGFRVRLLFQPGEEGFFGAVKMIEAGCLSGVSAIIGGHAGSISDELKTGQVGCIRGQMMASSDRFRGAFIGKGGHGANPHLCKDPIPAFAEFVLDLQRIRSREFSPLEPVVISICSVHGGTAFNVIPGRVDFSGTARALSGENRAMLEKRIGESANGIAALNGMECEFEWLPGYPPLINHSAVADLFLETARGLLGTGSVVEIKKPSMGGEDFTYYLDRVKGCFWFLETNNPAKGIVHPNHHPKFEIDESLLWIPLFLHANMAKALADELVSGRI